MQATQPTRNMVRRTLRITQILYKKHPKGALAVTLQVKKMGDKELHEFYNALHWRNPNIVSYTIRKGWMKFRMCQRRPK